MSHFSAARCNLRAPAPMHRRPNQSCPVLLFDAFLLQIESGIFTTFRSFTSTVTKPEIYTYVPLVKLAVFPGCPKDTSGGDASNPLAFYASNIYTNYAP